MVYPGNGSDLLNPFGSDFTIAPEPIKENQGQVKLHPRAAEKF
jgi:hypothetical protein